MGANQINKLSCVTKALKASLINIESKHKSTLKRCKQRMRKINVLNYKKIKSTSIGQDDKVLRLTSIWRSFGGKRVQKNWSVFMIDQSSRGFELNSRATKQRINASQNAKQMDQKMVLNIIIAYIQLSFNDGIVLKSIQ